MPRELPLPGLAGDIARLQARVRHVAGLGPPASNLEARPKQPAPTVHPARHQLDRAFGRGEGRR